MSKTEEKSITSHLAVKGEHWNALIFLQTCPMRAHLYSHEWVTPYKLLRGLPYKHFHALEYTPLVMPSSGRHHLPMNISATVCSMNTLSGVSSF